MLEDVGSITNRSGLEVSTLFLYKLFTDTKPTIGTIPILSTRSQRPSAKTAGGSYRRPQKSQSPRRRRRNRPSLGAWDVTFSALGGESLCCAGVCRGLFGVIFVFCWVYVQKNNASFLFDELFAINQSQISMTIVTLNRVKPLFWGEISKLVVQVADVDSPPSTSSGFAVASYARPQIPTHLAKKTSAFKASWLV